MWGCASSTSDLLCCLSSILWNFFTSTTGKSSSDASASSYGCTRRSLACWFHARSTLLDYQPGRPGRVRHGLQGERLLREAQTGCHQADQPERTESTKDDRSNRYV